MTTHQPAAVRRFKTLPSLGLLALLAASACSGPNPLKPSSLTGTWVGPVVSSAFGNATDQLTLTQTGTSISGFYSFTIPGQASSGGGALTGTVQGSAITLALPTGTCIRTWTGTVSGTTMAGTFVATGTCGNPDSGTFTLTLE
jgi:hypothetical protein